MSNHDLETSELPFDNSMANHEPFFGHPQLGVHPRFRLGERVRIGCGVFAGVEGIVQEFRQSSRLLLAVDAQQQGIMLEIDCFAVEPAD